MKKSIVLVMLIAIMFGSAGVLATVTDATNRVVYNCNGSATAFAFTFPIIDTSDMVVILRTVATGAETVLDETTHYSLSATNNDYSSGGTVTTVSTYSSAYTLTLIRNVPESQDANLEDSGTLRLESLEDALNRLTLLVQDLEEELARTVKFPRSDSVALTTELPNSVARSNMNITTGSDGGITATSQLVTGTANVSAFGATLIDDATPGAARGTLGLDTDDDVEFAEITATDLIAESPLFNVRVSGAVGDGVTDDADAINAAIGTGNRRVFFPYTADGYLISSSIVMKSNTVLEGAGRGTFIYPDAETFAAITITGEVKYWSIRDLSISYGEATGDVAATDTAAVGIQLLLDGTDYPYLFDISRVNIYYPYRGFEALDVASFMYSLKNVFVYKAGNYGYWIDPTTSATTITLENCFTNYNKGGFRIEKIKNLSLIACASDHTSENYPFYFESCKGIASGLYVEASTINDASINISGGEMQIVAPTFSSNTLTATAYEIRVLSGAQAEVVGGYNYATVASGAGTYAVCHASATAKQLIARGCAFGIPTGDGTKTIYLGNIRRYNANTTVEPIITLADEATPSISAGTIFITGGTTTITDFDDGVAGQVITVIAEHSLDITDGTNIFLDGSANWSMTATDTLTLICKADNKWYELSRADSGA